MSELVVEQWDTIKNRMKEEFELSDIQFDSWIAPLEVDSVSGEDLYLLYPLDTDKNFFSNYMTKNYSVQFQFVIQEITGVKYEIHFLVGDSSKKPSSSPKINKKAYQESNLNENYTFNTFVVGGSNRFAQAAALAVAEKPGDDKNFNPLYIHGGPGLGKTHLMHSIGNYILEQDPEKRVLYVTSEEFLNEVIDAIRSSNNTSSMSAFRDKYRNVDVLLVDDIQFIIGKESTQEEFFHTFNALYDDGKQIVLTSDRPPKELETLDLRFRSRFEWGLQADIGYPEYETRMAILRKKIENDNVSISDDVLNYIAENIKSNIRELEGALNKLIAYSQLEKTEINLEIATRELQNLISPDKPREITPQLIIEVVADHYGVTIDQMISKNRKTFISKPRQIAMYLCKTMTDCSLESIGSLLGGRNHSTIIHGADAIKSEYDTNEELHKQIDAIKKKIDPN